MQVSSFDAAQDVVLALMTPSIQRRPQIALRLTPKAEDWTDVLLNGMAVAQVPTRALALRKDGFARGV